jgi:hypothetical protein
MILQYDDPVLFVMCLDCIKISAEHSLLRKDHFKSSKPYLSCSVNNDKILVLLNELLIMLLVNKVTVIFNINVMTKYKIMHELATYIFHSVNVSTSF